MKKTKICIKCKEEKPKNTKYFKPRQESLDGLRSECRECSNEYHRQWSEKNKERLNEMYGEKRKEYGKQYNLKNNEKLKEQKRQYYQKNKKYFNKLSKDNYQKNRHHYNALSKLWYKRNREVELEKKKEYYQNNRDKKIQYNAYYMKHNREKIRISENRRISREKQLPATLTIDEWEFCKKEFNNKCAYCGEDKPLQQEHFIPVVKGGGYVVENIIPSCRECNTSKRARNFSDWYKDFIYYDKDREYKILQYLASIKKKKEETK